MDRAALDPRDTRIWIRRDQTVAGEECGFPAGEGHRTTCVNQTLRAYHTASRNRQPGGAAEMTLKRVGEDFVVMRHRRIRQGSSGGKGKVNDPSCGSLSADLALIKGAYAEERLSRLGTVGPCASLHPELGSNGTPSQGRKKNQNRHKGCGNRTRSTRNTTISGFVRREVRGTSRGFDGRGNGCCNVLRRRNQRDYGAINGLQTLDERSRMLSVSTNFAYWRLGVANQAFSDVSLYTRRYPD
jgi:hypothetical protein